MPSTSTVKSALANLAHRLPVSPTIVCVGGTSGIGEAIARKFTSITSKPNIHIVGRSENAANKIISDLKEVNPNGSYQFHA
jgi:NADP-dependent 3-hydroxy acid dehydrogenase YdfG